MEFICLLGIAENRLCWKRLFLVLHALKHRWRYLYVRARSRCLTGCAQHVEQCLQVPLCFLQCNIAWFERHAIVVGET